MPQTKSDVHEVSSVSDSDVLTAVTKMLEARSKAIEDGIKHDKDNKDPDGSTSKRGHWHAGYVVAMLDTLRMIKNRAGEWPAEIPDVGLASDQAHDPRLQKRSIDDTNPPFESTRTT